MSSTLPVESSRPSSVFRPAPPSRVGLLAGWGRYPLIVAEALRRQGVAVFGLGIKDHTDPVLAEYCEQFDWIGLGQIGRARRFFRRHGVRHATMAGKIHKITLFRPGMMWRHFPDWRGFCRFSSHFLRRTADCRDDTLLSAVIAEFALGGVTFAPATDFAPELLIAEGQLTRRAPTAAQRRDLEFGWTIAKEIGRLDIGQCVIVRDRALVAIEAIEGTDECIRRAGQLCQGAPFSVIKVAKPQQDMRFDVPTIGLGTLRIMAEAGGTLLAVEADRTILLDRRECLAYADQQRLAIVALHNPQAATAETPTAVRAA